MSFYLDLPAWLRTILAVVVLGVGLTMTVIGYRDRPRAKEIVLGDGRVMIDEHDPLPGSAAGFRYGILFTGIGTILLFLCGRSASEKSGYNF